MTRCPCFRVRRGQDLLSNPRVLLLMTLLWLAGSCMLVLGILVIMKLAHETTIPPQDNPTVMGINYMTAFILVVLAVITHLTVLLVFMTLMHIDRNNQNNTNNHPSVPTSPSATEAAADVLVKEADGPPSYETLLASETPPPPYCTPASSTDRLGDLRKSELSLKFDARLLADDVTYRSRSLPTTRLLVSDELGKPSRNHGNVGQNVHQPAELQVRGDTAGVVNMVSAEDNELRIPVVQGGEPTTVGDSDANIEITTNERPGIISVEVDKIVNSLDSSNKDRVSSPYEHKLLEADTESAVLIDMLQIIETLYKVGERAADFGIPARNASSDNPGENSIERDAHTRSKCSGDLFKFSNVDASSECFTNYTQREGFVCKTDSELKVKLLECAEINNRESEELNYDEKTSSLNAQPYTDDKVSCILNSRDYRQKTSTLLSRSSTRTDAHRRNSSCDSPSFSCNTPSSMASNSSSTFTCVQCTRDSVTHNHSHETSLQSLESGFASCTSVVTPRAHSVLEIKDPAWESDSSLGSLESLLYMNT